MVYLVGCDLYWFTHGVLFVRVRMIFMTVMIQHGYRYTVHVVVCSLPASLAKPDPNHNHTLNPAYKSFTPPTSLRWFLCHPHPCPVKTQGSSLIRESCSSCGGAWRGEESVTPGSPLKISATCFRVSRVRPSLKHPVTVARTLTLVLYQVKYASTATRTPSSTVALFVCGVGVPCPGAFVTVS